MFLVSYDSSGTVVSWSRAFFVLSIPQTPHAEGHAYSKYTHQASASPSHHFAAKVSSRNAGTPIRKQTKNPAYRFPFD